MTAFPDDIYRKLYHPDTEPTSSVDDADTEPVPEAPNEPETEPVPDEPQTGTV